MWTTVKSLLHEPSSLSIAMKLLQSNTGGLNVERLSLILSEKMNDNDGPAQFRAYAKYPDVLQHSWLILAKVDVKGGPEKLLSMMNALPVTTWEDCALLVPDESFKFDYQKVRKAINSCWHKVMREELSLATRKQALMVLLESLLNHIEKPILLTDFLMDSLHIGGPVSLLALQGIFTLIQEHNITYPNIYTKIYDLFNADIFHTKFKARLFYLTDLFLSSTHLPENLVGAFVKRVARLALGAPPQDIIIALYFITNLMMRHKGLKRFLNDPTAVSLLNDPFIMEEGDPRKSRALESSLWEVEALSQHVLPNVSGVAKNILKANQRTEFDLSQVLELTESDVSILRIFFILDRLVINSLIIILLCISDIRQVHQ